MKSLFFMLAERVFIIVQVPQTRYAPSKKPIIMYEIHNHTARVVNHYGWVVAILFYRHTWALYGKNALVTTLSIGDEIGVWEQFAVGLGGGNYACPLASTFYICACSRESCVLFLSGSVTPIPKDNSTVVAKLIIGAKAVLRECLVLR